jgi:hypothetical protein
LVGTGEAQSAPQNRVVLRPLPIALDFHEVCPGDPDLIGELRLREPARLAHEPQSLPEAQTISHRFAQTSERKSVILSVFLPRRRHGFEGAASPERWTPPPAR